MNRPTKVTPEELQQIANSKAQFNNITFAIGEAKVRVEMLLESYKKLDAQEKEFLNRLAIKYGNGSIDTSTGEITYLEPKVETNEQA